MKDKKVVVFDLDDTLSKEIYYLNSAFKEIAARIALETQKDEDKVYEQMTILYHSKRNAFKDILDLYPAPSLEINDLLIIYRTHKPNIQLYDETTQVLNFLKEQNITLGLLTDGRSEQQRNKIEALGIETYFSEIIISEEFGSEKPNINNYAYFEKVFGDAQYFYIGDNVKKDFITANKLGWITICLKDNGENIHSQKIELENVLYKAKYLVSSLKELPDVIGIK